MGGKGVGEGVAIGGLDCFCRMQPICSAMWLVFVVKQDVAGNPMTVGFGGTVRIMAQANHFAHWVE
jgi:hypothetical protein